MAESPENALDGVAVIGMAGRFPGARNLAEYWANLCAGRESIERFSDEDLAAAGVSPDLLRDPKYVKAGVRLPEADCFDAPFFGYVPREADLMDPQQRLFLECAWHALEDAGYDPSGTPGSVGIFGGCGLNSYLLRNLCTNPATRDTVTDFATMLGNDKDFLTVRTAYKLNLKGPAVTVQTACSTSLVAVVHAWQALQAYQCDMAIAGGVAVHSPLVEGYLFKEGMILSPDGHCRAFDARAQGTVPGAGVGIVVLKRLADAVAAGDRVLAVIRGAAMNNDGAVKVGFTAPSVDGQAECIAAAQALADVTPDTLSYIETHGTGTPLGDPIEIAALTQAFRAGTDRTQFCAIGSAKPNIGHADAAAGIAGLIKLVLALQHRKIPPSLHYDTPNPKIDFASGPFFVNRALVDWKPGRTPRRGAVSSFGIGGTNAHCVLEESPVASPSGPSRPVQLLAWSARTDAALDRATADLAAHLRGAAAGSLPDVAFTLQAGRHAFEHRRALVCRGGEEAARALETRDERRWVSAVARPEPPPVVFLFPGQGCQFIRMGEELYRTEAVFRSEVDSCAEYLQPLLGLDLRQVLYPPAAEEAAARERIHETRVAQPAIFTIELALARLWMSWGIQPAALAGHSIGEYVAAVIAGVFSLDEALGLLAARARMMQGLPPGGMLAVKLGAAELEPLLAGQPLAIAASNSPTLTVVSGPSPDIEALRTRLASSRVVSKPLGTSHAFHSAMIDPVLPGFTELVSRTRRQPPRIPMMSTLNASWFTGQEAADPGYWARQMRHSVRFVEAMHQLLRTPARVYLEVGPGQTLTPFVRQHPSRDPLSAAMASLPPTQDPGHDLESMLGSLGRLWSLGVTVDWAGFRAGERRCRVALPGYPFERTRHWVDPGTLAAPATPPSAPERDTSPPDPDGGAVTEEVMERLMAEQFKIMQEQLEILRTSPETSL